MGGGGGEGREGEGGREGGELNFELLLWVGGGGVNRKDPHFHWSTSEKIDFNLRRLNILRVIQVVNFG